MTKPPHPHPHPGKDPIENMVGKGENAGNQYILLFGDCFLSKRQRSCFLSKRQRSLFKLCTFILSSANAFNLVTSKILSLGKELKKFF